MKPGENEQNGFEELDLVQLSNELAIEGKSKFREKYPHTFFVSVSQQELDADIYAHKTAISSDSNERDTMENPPRIDEESRESSQKKTCYGVVKKGRTSFTSKITVGRSRNNDIVLRSQKISKIHAALIQGEKHDWQIEDLGSTNGTKINDKQLDANHPFFLRSGDIVSFATLSFRFLTWEDFYQVLVDYACKPNYDKP